MKRKLVLPWRYLAMLAVGLAVLFGLVASLGRSPAVLLGWLVAWLVISRGSDAIFRARARRRFTRDDEP